MVADLMEGRGGPWPLFGVALTKNLLSPRLRCYVAAISSLRWLGHWDVEDDTIAATALFFARLDPQTEGLTPADVLRDIEQLRRDGARRRLEDA
jgi:hypothetical protein